MSCPTFIAESMAVRTAAHLLHLSAKTYSTHVALASFYEALMPLVDAYAEVYMGANAQVTSWPSVKLPTGDATSTLMEYLDLVKEELEEDHDSEALKNILAEIEQLTAQTLYKLRFLK